MRTTPPERDTVLYDGDCNFCVKAAGQLRALTGADVELLSFRAPYVLARFPGVTAEACLEAMQFIRRDGEVFEGAEAAVRALQGRWFGRAALLYYAPGVRQAADLAYRLIARYRFRLAGRRCDGGSCQLHMH